MGKVLKSRKSGRERRREKSTEYKRDNTARAKNGKSRISVEKDAERGGRGERAEVMSGWAWKHSRGLEVKWSPTNPRIFAGRQRVS